MNESKLQPRSKLIFSNGIYDLMKKLVQIIFPATASLYFGLGQTWGLPAIEQVVGTLALVATFLGVSLGISTKSYNSSDERYAGQIVLMESEGKKLYSLELNGDPEDLDQMKEVTFKVGPLSSNPNKG